MSIATPSPAASTRQYIIQRCLFCEAHYPESYGFNNEYCREICKYRDKARSALRVLDYDHRYCSSCHQKLKTVFDPTLTEASAKRGKSIPECATGEQEFAPHTTQGAGELLKPRDLVNGDAKHVPSGLETTRMVCSCGVCHHRTIDSLARKLSKRELVRRAEHLCDALDELITEEAVTDEYRRGTLFTYVKKAKEGQFHEGKPRRLFRRGLALAIREADR